MARRSTPLPPEPFPSFEDDDDEVVRWPPTHLFDFVPDIAAVDRIIMDGRASGRPRETLTTLRAMFASQSEDGFHWVLADPSGVVGCLGTSRMADLVFQTRSALLYCRAEVERLAARDSDFVKIIGSDSPHFCTAFVGLAFSISGRSVEYPPLSSLPYGGCPFHPGCSKRFVPFNPRWAAPADLERSLVRGEDRAMFDSKADLVVRMDAARRRVSRLLSVALAEVV